MNKESLTHSKRVAMRICKRMGPENSIFWRLMNLISRLVTKLRGSETWLNSLKT